MSIRLAQRPFRLKGYAITDFHYFTNEDIEVEYDLATPSRSAEFLLIMILEGAVKGKIDLQDVEIKKNCAILVSPNAVLRIFFKSENCRFVGIAFKSSFLTRIEIVKHRQDVFKVFTNYRTPIIQLTEEEMEMPMTYMKNIEHKYTHLQSHLFAEEIIQTNFLSILYELANIARRQGEPIPRKISRKAAIVIKFGTLMMKHFKERKQLEFYANKIFITPKYLTETVKELTGQTAGEILDDLVIREAKILLEDPNTSISEVAIELNFSDQSFFGKYFKRHTGYSPREYRAQNLI